MKANRFTEEQIIGILQQAEAGAKAVDLCRQHGMGEATFYQWKAKYGGLQVSDAQKLKRLEEENAKLKRGWPTSPWTTWHSRICSEKNGRAGGPESGSGPFGARAPDE